MKSKVIPVRLSSDLCRDLDEIGARQKRTRSALLRLGAEIVANLAKEGELEAMITSLESAKQKSPLRESESFSSVVYIPHASGVYLPIKDLLESKGVKVVSMKGMGLSELLARSLSHSPEDNESLQESSNHSSKCE